MLPRLYHFTEGGEADESTPPSLDDAAEERHLNRPKVVDTGAGEWWLENLESGRRKRGHKG